MERNEAEAAAYQDLIDHHLDKPQAHQLGRLINLYHTQTAGTR